MMDNTGMSVRMSRTRTVLFVLAVWATSFTVMWQMSELVIVNDLYEAFPAQGGLVTLIMSWPAMATALASLAAGWMMKKVSTKTELVLAGILMLAGIVAPMGSNIYTLTICSFLMAIGAGFANTAGMAIISEVFLDEGKRAAQMGYYNAAMALLGAAISFLAGRFALQGWTFAFRINWFAVPMLIMTILFIPAVHNEQETEQVEAGAAERSVGEKKFGSRFWLFFIAAVCFFLSYCFNTYLSVFIAEHELGDTSYTGIATALGTIGSMFSCLAFGTLYSRLHRKVTFIYMIIPVLAYLWIMLLPGKVSCAAFSALYGFCYGGMFTFIFAYAAEIVPPETIGFVMGLMTFGSTIAITLGSNAFGLLMGSMGSITATIPCALGLLAAAIIIELIGSAKAAEKR